MVQVLFESEMRLGGRARSDSLNVTDPYSRLRRSGHRVPPQKSVSESKISLSVTEGGELPDGRGPLEIHRFGVGVAGFLVSTASEIHRNADSGHGWNTSGFSCDEGKTR